MPIKIKIRPDGKAMIRFTNRLEQEWFTNMMQSIRDSDPKAHPKISLKDKDGDIPMLPKEPSKPIKIPEKLTPEMIKQLKIQPVKIPEEKE